MQKHYIITTRQDTITESIETFTERQPPAFRTDLNLQAGAFRDLARAEALGRKLSFLIDKPTTTLKTSYFNSEQFGLLFIFR